MALIKGKQIQGWSTTGGKLEAAVGDAGKILVVDPAGEFQKVLPSGDVALSTAGALSLNPGVVDTAELADNAVTLAKMADNSVDTAELVDGAVQTAKLEDAAVTTAKLADAAGSGTGVTLAKLDPDLVATDLSGAVDDTSFATAKAAKDYADSVAQGLDIKDSVRVLADSNIDLTSDLSTASIDGVALSAGDRILLKAQTTGSENGVYVVAAGAGNTARSAAFPAGYNAAGAFMFVEEGNTYQDTGWVCSSDNGSDVVGTDALVFTQFSAAGVVNAGVALSKSGNDIDLDINSITTALNLGGVDTQNDLFAIYDADANEIKKVSTISAFGSALGNHLEVDGATVNVMIHADEGLKSGAAGGIALDLNTEQSLKIGAGTGLQAPVMQLDSAASAVATQGQTTGVAISLEPAADSAVAVFLNGVKLKLAGAAGTGDCYFKDSAGTAIRALADITSTDVLWWDSADFNLDANDLIEIQYTAFNA